MGNCIKNGDLTPKTSYSLCSSRIKKYILKKGIGGGYALQNITPPPPPRHLNPLFLDLVTMFIVFI